MANAAASTTAPYEAAIASSARATAALRQSGVASAASLSSQAPLPLPSAVSPSPQAPRPPLSRRAANASRPAPLRSSPTANLRRTASTSPLAAVAVTLAAAAASPTALPPAAVFKRSVLSAVPRQSRRSLPPTSSLRRQGPSGKHTTLLFPSARRPRPLLCLRRHCSSREQSKRRHYWRTPRRSGSCARVSLRH